MKNYSVTIEFREGEDVAFFETLEQAEAAFKDAFDKYGDTVHVMLADAAVVLKSN